MIQGLDEDIELAQAVDVMMARAQRNLHFDIQSLQVVLLLAVALFSKRNRRHVLLASIEL